MYSKRRVIILGGGAAGWMTAKYLSVHNEDVEVTLIEAPNKPTIGVGESTTPHLAKWLKSIGIHEDKEWMPKCNATYKNGVLYEDWDYIGARFWHAFEADEWVYPYWNIKREEEGLDRQDYWTSTMYTGHAAMRDSSKWLADKDGVIPEYYQSQSYNGFPQHYAYHIDAGAFTEFLKEITEVTHVYADIIDIRTNEDGIEKLIDAIGIEYTADLYIDCTGFKKELISKVNDDFTKFDPYLTHDKALVIPCPYLDKETEMRPRTKSKAMNAGWAWEIPLYNRIGNGYVYTSSYISDEEAEKEFRDYLGNDRVKDCKSFIVDIETGYYDRPFTKNVVAVGLSAGFIEPLEATLLYAVQVAGMNVSEYLKGTKTSEEHNQEASYALGAFLDFISSNYYLSKRRDTPFWKSQDTTHLTEKMHRWINESKEELKPSPRVELFVDSSWVSKAIGFNLFPENAMFERYDETLSKLADSWMEKIRTFDYTGRISQKEYLDTFIYRSTNGNSRHHTRATNGSSRDVRMVLE